MNILSAMAENYTCLGLLYTGVLKHTFRQPLVAETSPLRDWSTLVAGKSHRINHHQTLRKVNSFLITQSSMWIPLVHLKL